MSKSPTTSRQQAIQDVNATLGIDLESLPKAEKKEAVYTFWRILINENGNEATIEEYKEALSDC